MPGPSPHLSRIGKSKYASRARTESHGAEDNEKVRTPPLLRFFKSASHCVDLLFPT